MAACVIAATHVPEPHAPFSYAPLQFLPMVFQAVPVVPAAEQVDTVLESFRFPSALIVVTLTLTVVCAALPAFFVLH
jgi:hypothetical protein